MKRKRQSSWVNFSQSSHDAFVNFLIYSPATARIGKRGSSMYGPSRWCHVYVWNTWRKHRMGSLVWTANQGSFVAKWPTLCLRRDAKKIQSSVSAKPTHPCLCDLAAADNLQPPQLISSAQFPTLPHLLMSLAPKSRHCSCCWFGGCRSFRFSFSISLYFCFLISKLTSLLHCHLLDKTITFFLRETH